MASIDAETHTVETPDGARLEAFDTGGEGAPVVLVNGLGGPFSTWKHQVDFLRERHRIVSFSYRGLFGSTCPEDGETELGVPAHAADLALVVRELGVERAAFVGWSMGAQVALELYRQTPEAVSHLVLVNGTFGRAFDTAKIPLAELILPRILRRSKRLGGVGSRVLRRAAGWPETVVWLKRLGIVGATIDEDIFRDVAPEFGAVDVDLYMRMLKLLGEHDTAPVLDQITVPTLVIAGERDLFTPPAVAEEHAKRIEGAELLVVRGATHYTPIEYPELVNLRIEKFLREHGFGADR